MKVMRAADPEQLIPAATGLAMQAIALLTEAGDFRAIAYLRQVVAILDAQVDAPGAADTRVAMNLLRMARVLLDRSGASEAAGDVESALERLGEPFPALSDPELNARLDWKRSRNRG